MTEKNFEYAYESIPMDPALSDRLLGRLLAEAPEASPDKEVIMKRTRTGKVWRTLLIAAVIAMLLGATAYAAGFLGPRALIVDEPRQTPGKLVLSEDGQTAERVENPEGAVFSLTQPQDLPDDIDEDIREKVELNRAAWSVWEEESAALRVEYPEAMEAPEGTWLTDKEELEDGGAILRFYALAVSGEELQEKGPYPEDDWEAYKAAMLADGNLRLLEERTVTAQDIAQEQAYFDRQQGVPGYDYFYGLGSQEEAALLEDVAARYGLALRHDREVLFGSSHEYDLVHGPMDWMTEEQWQEQLNAEDYGQPAAQVLDALAEACGRGPIFDPLPACVDHLYWFDEGSFAVMYTELMEDGGLAECYAYNSMYGTLSSGQELFEEIEEPSAYEAREYTSADGTVVTLLESSHRNVWGWADNSYIYVYLNDSFFVVNVRNENGVSPQALEAIADHICYQNINA